jgi:hypothetical protein
MSASETLFKQIDPGDMCEPCMALLGAGVHAPRHASLKFLQDLGDECDYRCATCGCLWIHDSGAGGGGWTRAVAL